MQQAGMDRRGFLAGGAGAAAALTTMTALSARARGGRAASGRTSSGSSARTTTRTSAPTATLSRARRRIDKLAAEGVRYETATPPRRSARRRGSRCITGHVRRELRARAQHARIGKPAGLRSGASRSTCALAGYYCTNNAKTDYNATIDMAATWDESSAAAHWRNRPPGAPFFAHLHHADDARVAPLRRRSAADDRPDDVRDPGLPAGHAATRDGPARATTTTWPRMDAELAARLAELEADGLADDTIVFYYGDNGGVAAALASASATTAACASR